MGDDRSDNCFNQTYEEGWQRGRDHLFSAFLLATSLSKGLSPDDIEELAEFSSLLSHCFSYIAGREQYMRE